jgi:hypothetical protein
MNEGNTDPARRLALQLAIQLPADVAEAHQALALTKILLDDFLAEGNSSAHRRARQLGWGAAREHLKLVPPSAAPPREVPPLCTAAWTVVSLMLALPIAMLLQREVGYGAGMVFATEVTLVALIFGSLPALALAAVIPMLHNLVVIPPLMHFNTPSRAELVLGFSYVVLALLVPWVADRRQAIRRIAIVRSPARLDTEQQQRRSA